MRTPPQLPRHQLSIALFQPQIAPNTGNVARLCVATGTRLHLVRPLGFVLSDQKLKRSAMDYWPRLALSVHDDTEAFLGSIDTKRLWLFTSKAETSFWDAEYRDGDYLAFGSETGGLPGSVLERYPDQRVRVPQTQDERCLNLSTAVGIGLYEALRRLRGAGR